MFLQACIVIDVKFDRLRSQNAKEIAAQGTHQFSWLPAFLFLPQRRFLDATRSCKNFEAEPPSAPPVAGEKFADENFRIKHTKPEAHRKAVAASRKLVDLLPESGLIL